MERTTEITYFATDIDKNPLPLSYVKPLQMKFNGKHQDIWQTDDLSELKQDMADRDFVRYWCAEYSYYLMRSHYSWETEKEDLDIREVK
jgi:hypothetical protein